MILGNAASNLSGPTKGYDMRTPKPWWHAQKKQWCCKIANRLYTLGEDYEDAVKAFHRLRGEVVPRIVHVKALTVLAVLEHYLDRQQARTSERNYQWCLDTCTSFYKHVGDIAAADLKPHHLTSWVSSQAWSDSTKRRRMVCIQSAFIYADRQGIHRPNPIAWVDKPSYTPRQDIVDANLWREVVSRASGDFRPLLAFSAATGCRPQEATAIEARHVSPDYRVVLYQRQESKGKRKPRIIYVPWTVRGDLWARCLVYPSGPLFRNQRGNRFTKDSVNCAFRRIREAIKRDTGKDVRVNHYMLRHTWVTGALAKGIPVAIVAELAGHSPEMALGNYGHLDGRLKDLLDAAEKASG